MSTGLAWYGRLGRRPRPARCGQLTLAGDVAAEVNCGETRLWSAAIIVAADWRALFGLTLSGRWSPAIEWRGSTLADVSNRDGVVAPLGKLAQLPSPNRSGVDAFGQIRRLGPKFRVPAE
jgi:hypothetical protein